MAKRRNFSFEIESGLLSQIRKRAEVSGISNNDQMRSLIQFAISNAHLMQEAVFVPEGEKTRTVVWVDIDDEAWLRDRAKLYQRSTGKELVRMFAFAIEEIARRDLELIKTMLSRQAQSVSGTEAFAPAP